MHSQSNRGCMISRMMVLLIISLAIVVPTAEGEQPGDCRLYQVTANQSSLILEVSGSHSETYISLGLLFANSSATITISNGGSDIPLGNDTSSISMADVVPSNSCQMTVNKENGTLRGNCFNDRDIPLKCTQDEGMDTLLVRRNGPVVAAFIEGENNKVNVLNLTPSNKLKFQVTSDTIVNTAFNCKSNCFLFENAIIHSEHDLTLSAKQISIGVDVNSTGVIKVLHGENLENTFPFNFSYFQNNDQDDAGDPWKEFSVTSEYNVTDIALSVNGSLIGSEDPVLIGPVPNTDTYFKFEDMDNVLWSTCSYKSVGEESTSDIMPDVTDENTTSSFVDIVNGVTGEVTDDSDLEANTEVAIKENSETSTSVPAESTTRYVEEISCKDTREPKCTLTLDQNGSCNCGEAKANGWCDTHAHIKENCKRTCGLCPDQDGAISGRNNKPDKTNEIEGSETTLPADSSVDTTGSPNARTASGNTFVYVMIGIVVVMLLVLLIWLTCKKRKASGHMDLEGQSQSMSLKESTEKTSENNKDTDSTDKQEKKDNNEGAKNIAFQEQDEVKDTTKENDEKANVKDDNKGTGENSPTKDENDSKDTADKSPTNNASENAAEKDTDDKADIVEDTKDDVNQGDDSTNGEPEKNGKAENGNENASKGITDSLENEKSVD